MLALGLVDGGSIEIAGKSGLEGPLVLNLLAMVATSRRRCAAGGRPSGFDLDGRRAHPRRVPHPAAELSSLFLGLMIFP